MRNGFLGSLLLLGLGTSLASAQAPVSPILHVTSGQDDSWQPPRTDLDDRPNVGPLGYAMYGQLDYLLWLTAQDGAVHGLPGGPAKAIFGTGTDFGLLFRQGTEGVLGMWLDPQQRFGLEAGGLWLDNRYPGWRGGAADVGIHNDLTSRLWGAECDGRAELWRGSFGHLDCLGGFRHLSLDETLAIAERDVTGAAVTSDRFATRNRFYGGQLGLEAEAHHGTWSIDVFAKAALGGNSAAANVNGTTLVAGHATSGGLLVAPGSSGGHRADVFAVVPEVGIHLAYELTNNLRVTAGYGFLYLSDAARPAEQTDILQHNPHGFLPQTNGDFWGQGISLGLEFRF
jgi:hypothetical protein